MDSSGSMEDSRQKLEDASKDIAKAIGELTSDFRLGFGSYNDKPTFPFSKEIDSYGENPPYAFKHEKDLTTNDTEKFKEAVKTLDPINNVDSPESGLDAIAQALLCDGQDGQENIINWRNESEGVQKVIIVITDQEMHYAGLITISKRLQ